MIKQNWFEQAQYLGWNPTPNGFLGGPSGLQGKVFLVDCQTGPRRLSVYGADEVAGRSELFHGIIGYLPDSVISVFPDSEKANLPLNTGRCIDFAKSPDASTAYLMLDRMGIESGNVIVADSIRPAIEAARKYSAERALKFWFMLAPYLDFTPLGMNCAHLAPAVGARDECRQAAISIHCLLNRFYELPKNRCEFMRHMKDNEINEMLCLMANAASNVMDAFTAAMRVDDRGRK